VLNVYNQWFAHLNFSGWTNTLRFKKLRVLPPW
jgi:hypothetical protein